jgi:hypothetical protein
MAVPTLAAMPSAERPRSVLQALVAGVEDCSLWEPSPPSPVSIQHQGARIEPVRSIPGYLCSRYSVLLAGQCRFEPLPHMGHRAAARLQM